MIRYANKGEIEKIVSLHLESLKDGALFQLGKSTLKIFYEGMLSDKNSFILVYISNNDLVGAAASSKDVGALFNTIKKKYFAKLAFNVLKKSLSNPKLPFKLIQNYPSEIKAELLFLFVDASQRGKGIGEKLVAATSKEFSARGINKYKITILSSNIRGKNFYERIGFKKTQTYVSMGEERDIYIYDAGK